LSLFLYFKVLVSVLGHLALILAVVLQVFIFVLVLQSPCLCSQTCTSSLQLCPRNSSPSSRPQTWRPWQQHW